MPDVTMGVKGADTLISQNKKIDNSLKALHTSTTRQNNEKARLERVYQAILKDTETAQERLTRQTEDARRAFAEKAGNVKALERALKSYRAEYERAIAKEKQLAEQKGAEKLKQTLQELKPLAATFQQRMEALAEPLQGLDTNFSEMAVKAEEVFGETGTSRLVKWGTVLSGAMITVQQINAEMQRNQQLVDARTSVQERVGQAQNTLLGNISGESQQTKDMIFARTREIASKYGISEAYVADAMAEAYSASNADVQKTLAGVEYVAKRFWDRPEEMGTAAGSLIDIWRQMPQGATIEQAAGLLTVTGQLSRVVNPQMQYRNIGQGVVGMTQMGASPEASAALFVALSSAGADPEGQRTGSGGVRFVEQLKEYDLRFAEYTDSLTASQTKTADAKARLDEMNQYLTEIQADRQKDYTEKKQELEKDRAEAWDDFTNGATPSARAAARERWTRVNDELNALKPRTYGDTAEEKARLRDRDQLQAELAAAQAEQQAAQDRVNKVAPFVDQWKGMDAAQRMDFLMKNPEFGKSMMDDEDFVANLQLEAKVIAAAQKLFEPGSVARQAYDKAIEKLADPEYLRQQGLQVIADIDANPLNAPRRVSRTLERAAEASALLHMDSLSSQDRENMKTIMRENAGKFGFSTEFSNFWYGLFDGAKGLSYERGMELMDREGRNMFNLGTLKDQSQKLIWQQMMSAFRQQLEIMKKQEEKMENTDQNSQEMIDILKQIRDLERGLQAGV